MGFGLCLMAANYPEGSFVGVDFHPEHISHSQWLADQLGLNNIRFLEADFVALQQDASSLGLTPGHNGLYHYVCAHGIATWIAEPVQAALLALAAAASSCGAVGSAQCLRRMSRISPARMRTFRRSAGDSRTEAVGWQMLPFVATTTMTRIVFVEREREIGPAIRGVLP
jgi:hypothetical protein